ncbi:MAG: hypothetical protein M3070_06185 [Actinomycetota bacterium]|nr:hypothetical protein [Actinomycetota bacterium]
MSDRARLRITAWPGGVVPVPPVLVEPYVLDGEWLLLRAACELEEPVTYRYDDLGPELYLRDAADVDLADATALLNFTNEHGRFAPRHDLDSDLPANSRHPMSRHSAQHGRSHQRPDSADSGVRLHVDEVGWRLRVLRQLTAHAVAYRHGDYVHDVWPDHQSWPAGWDKEALAWQAFTRFTNAALRPFHARVWVAAGDPDFDIGAADPSSYEAAVLQLVNDLVDDVEYRVCPHCGRLFGRQVGGSQHYSRRSGVTFCTPACARAAGVRSYRARKRAEKESK